MHRPDAGDTPASLMLFAAGFGRRMGRLTADRPKPLLTVAGRPLIDHALQIARAGHVTRIVVNLHYLGDQIAAHLAQMPDVALSREHPTLLDTGGGLRAALPMLGPGPVFTLNSDAVWTGPNPLATLRSAWRPDLMDALLLLVPLGAAAGHDGPGDFATDPSGRISRGPGPVYTGAQIIRTDLLNGFADGPFPMMSVWTRLIAAGRAFGVMHTGGWCDAGHPGGIAAAETMLDDLAQATGRTVSGQIAEAPSGGMRHD